MKYIFSVTLFSLLMLFSQSCRISKHINKTTRHINKAIAAKDTSAVVVNRLTSDSATKSILTIDNLHLHFIDFKTFNAKVKVQYEDSKGPQPDIIAVVRIMKDSAIWISLSATLLNFEVFRLLITRDSVILLNMREREVQYRSLDYLQDLTEIPFDFTTLQNLLIGNPVFLDSNIVSYKKTDTHILALSVGAFFKHLLTLSSDNNILLHSKLDDVDLARNRTADITYGEYENNTGIEFSTYRAITVSEKNKLDIRLYFKQYQFNNVLSVSFRVPKNFKIK